MIIPIKCVTCGAVIADKWVYYDRKCRELDHIGQQEEQQKEENTYPHNFDKNFKGKILDEIGVTKVCCRRHMLGHVDLVDEI